MVARTFFYCKSWFRAKKRATELWSVEQAKKAHDRRQPYTVLVDSAEHPLCFLEIAEKFVGVGFLDDCRREHLVYQFQEVEPGTLFLATAIHREFDADTDAVAGGTSYAFGRDGIVQIRRESFKTGQAETSRTVADVNSNYSPWPEFGSYDDLIRIERQ